MRRFYVLLCFLLLFFISVLNLNTSYAFTFEEFYEFCDSNYDKASPRCKNQITYLRNNKQAIINKFLDNNDSVDNYDSFVLLGVNNYNLSLKVLNFSNTNSAYYFGTNIFYYKLTTNRTLQANPNLSLLGINTQTSSSSFSNISGLDGAIGLFSKPAYNGQWGSLVGNNIYVGFTIRQSENLDINNTNEFIIADTVVGDSYSNITFELYDLNDNYVKTFGVYDNGATGNGMHLYALFLTNLNGIINGDYYNVKFKANETYFYTSQDFKISWTRDTSNDVPIYNSSGDITSSIDLTSTNNKLDNIHSAIRQQTIEIISGDKAIENAINNLESGEQARHDFWVDTYNNLFTMNSGDVNELYNLAESYFPSGETPLSIYDTIFGSFDNEPDDFIIRWDNHKLNITWFGGETLYSGDFIAAGSINFSKECRDNEILSLIKFWFNTFVVIGFLITYYTTLYKCFCHIIGVTAEEYQEDSDNYKRNDIGFKM